MAATQTIRRVRRLVAAVFKLACSATLLCAAAGADEPPADRSVPALLSLYSAISSLPLPQVSPAEIDELLAGDAVVKVSDHAQSGAGDELIKVGVYGLKIVEAPRLLIWLAVMGGNDERDERLTTAMLSRGAAGSYTRYQHIDLPWPVRDRHWVIFCEKNPAVAIDSGGLIWEHRWQLADSGAALLTKAQLAGRIPGLSTEDLNGAIYLPENQGAWTMMELDAGRTLVVAYLNADLGGRFPGPVVRRFTRSNLKAGLASLQELSSRVHLNYSSERPIHNGFGELVSPQEALDAAADWPGALRIASLQR
ncbi:MAG: hypothetical protein WBN34_02155 [Woeseia sp.]